MAAMTFSAVTPEEFPVASASVSGSLTTGVPDPVLGVDGLVVVPGVFVVAGGFVVPDGFVGPDGLFVSGGFVVPTGVAGLVISGFVEGPEIGVPSGALAPPLPGETTGDPSALLVAVATSLPAFAASGPLAAPQADKSRESAVAKSSGELRFFISKE
jgi:hypothetical protein